MFRYLWNNNDISGPLDHSVTGHSVNRLLKVRKLDVSGNCNVHSLQFIKNHSLVFVKCVELGVWMSPPCQFYNSGEIVVTSRGEIAQR